MNANAIQSELAALGNVEQAAFAQKFFKTHAGGYGEGDQFRGIRVPILRAVARKYFGLPLNEAKALLHSPFHEDRAVALFILVRAMEKGTTEQQNAIYQLYCRNLRFINNWDLVDISAPHIVGAWLRDRDKTPLYEWAASSILWQRRIAMLATFTFIRAGDFEDALRLAKVLLHDPHDLMHKAVGWMLREIGKRDRLALEEFLNAHHQQMPRTMLRYAIEKLSPDQRKHYMARDV